MLQVTPPEPLDLFVKSISLFNGLDAIGTTALTFYADGYPGLMYQHSGGMRALPHAKDMPVLFLYGQTIHPVALELTGAFELVSYQLYPFVLQSFFGVAPATLNDDCHDLTAGNTPSAQVANRLSQAAGQQARMEILDEFLHERFLAVKDGLDFSILQAINEIVADNGRSPIEAVCRKLHVTERTLERKFKTAVGIPPKQFAKMIRFQHSLEQVSGAERSGLTDAAYANGYADQSHLIKVFRAFTGKTPKHFIAR